MSHARIGGQRRGADRRRGENAPPHALDLGGTRNGRFSQGGGGSRVGSHDPGARSLRPRRAKGDRRRLSHDLVVGGHDERDRGGVAGRAVEGHVEGGAFGDRRLASSQGVHAGRIGDGDAHVSLSRRRGEAQQGGSLRVHAEDGLRGRWNHSGRQGRTLRDFAVHEGCLRPGGNPSPVGAHVYGQRALVGEPPGEQHRGRGTCRDRDLTRCGVERTRRAVPVDADDRGCGAGVGEDQNHVGTRGGRAGRDPLGCASGRAANGAEAGEFAAALTGEGEGCRDHAALTGDRNGCGRHGSRGQRGPGGARGDVRGLKGVDDAGGTSELDLGRVRALRGTFHGGGS